MKNIVLIIAAAAGTFILSATPMGSSFGPWFTIAYDVSVTSDSKLGSGKAKLTTSTTLEYTGGPVPVAFNTQRTSTAEVSGDEARLNPAIAGLQIATDLPLAGDSATDGIFDCTDIESETSYKNACRDEKIAFYVSICTGVVGGLIGLLAIVTSSATIHIKKEHAPGLKPYALAYIMLGVFGIGALTAVLNFQQSIKVAYENWISHAIDSAMLSADEILFDHEVIATVTWEEHTRGLVAIVVLTFTSAIACTALQTFVVGAGSKGPLASKENGSGLSHTKSTVEDE